jgi:HEAT repeat protein
LSQLALHRLASLVASETDVAVWRSVLQLVDGCDAEPAIRITHVAASQQSPDVRRRACEAMASQQRVEHAEVLVQLLDDADAAVVRAAVKAVGHCGPVDDVAPLKRLLLSPDNALRIDAATSLARLGSASGTAALDRLSYDADQSVRQQVATALGELGDRANLPVLIRLLDDRPGVRRAALESLPKIVEPPFAAGADADLMAPEKTAEQWKTWHREQEPERRIRL